MKNKQKLFKKGFTLIELMVVIVILGVLIAAGLSSFISSQQKGRDSRRKSDLRGIGQALESYYNDYGKYPANDASGEIMGCGASAVACPWGTGFIDGKGTTYMVTLPTDPLSTQVYYYKGSGASGYQLYAKTENVQDPEYKVGGYLGTNCDNGGTAVCTYGISSSNLSP